MIDRRAFIALGVASAFARPSWAQDDADVSKVKAEVERIVAAFLEEAGAAAGGLQPPRVFVDFTPQLIWAEWPSNEVHTATWSQCPEPLRDSIASLLGDDAPMSPSEFFYEVFNGFLVAHEMSHLVDFAHGREHAPGSLYADEARANRAAVAFWLTQPGGRERLSRLMGVVETIWSRLPSPAPAGADAVAYFEENYEQLGASFEAYGWYQFRMFLDAWSARDSNTLAEILTEGL